VTLEELQRAAQEALAEITATTSGEALEQARVKFLGRKGLITQALRSLGSLPVEDRPQFGQEANRLKKLLETQLEEAQDRLKKAALQAEAVTGLDVTLPGRRLDLGRLHPITQIAREICDIFIRMGFQVVEGLEIETDYYNFEALNIPRDHPARDMQDTFYISDNIVLRTHTSPMQVRVMEQQQPPVRIIAPGKTFRRDSDLTHTPMFHQVEGLLVDKNISFADLKGVLTAFVHEMFGPEVSLRFRPSFFPFTEPSAEVDIQCVICRGAGCRVCSQTGWLEILGSGMVDPEVFGFVNYDPEVYTGFAFGMGIERIAMLKFGIDDLRLFFDNDLRFLKQF
jgi:phenylalanyl-tRNA synthetase alpha chain